jgi:hypothetical protein
LDLVDLPRYPLFAFVSSWCDASRLKDVMLDVRQRRAPPRYVRRLAAVGKLILAFLSWGFSIAPTKIVLEQLTPVDVFGIEILVSAIRLAFLAVDRGARPSHPRCCINQAPTDNLADPAPNSQFPPL